MKLNLRVPILCVFVISFLNNTAQVTKLSNNTNLEQGVALGNIGVMLAASDSLWSTDGTPAGTMKYATNVSDSSGFAALLNNKIYFSGIDAANGEELWVTDGTAGGTNLVTDIEPGTTGSSPQEMIVFNNTLYFFATTTTNGTELWKSDGTTTTLVKDINPGTASSYGTTANFFVNNNILYFVADNGTNGTELWKTNGTAGGTVMVSDINPTGSSNPDNFAALGTDVIFSATDGVNGEELWKTDGTTTTMVKDINPAAGQGSSPAQFMLFNGKLYFTTSFLDLTDPLNPVFDNQIWVTDGSGPNTTLVKGGFNSFPILFDAVFMNNKFYFPASTAAAGSELWSSDGTPGNTQIFMDVLPGSGSSSPLFLFDFIGATSINDFHSHLYNGKIFFEANDSIHGTELWITDGTVGGTSLVKDINTTAGTDPGTTADAVAGNFNWFYTTSGIYFAADDGATGNELWKSDGSSGGTTQVIDLNNGAGDSDPEFMMLLNQQLLFTADDGDNISGDRDLYKLDGTFSSLPLQLLTFNAAPTGKSVLLNWLTNTEINTSHFDVERSTDGNNFNKIGGVNALNLQQRNTYTFNDENALLLGIDKLFYRLKLYDKDGKFTYSKIEVVNVKASGEAFYTYPNPAHSDLKVMVNTLHEQRATVQISDANGRPLFKLPVKIVKGANQYNINVASYPNGIYYIDIITSEGKRSLRFIKQ